MQQRQLRLGDVLDDYCPRERRLTNHAVVAMVGNEVKRTRCTTCDAEHEYKHAKVPRPRKKDEPAAAFQAAVPVALPKRPSPLATSAGSDVLVRQASNPEQQSGSNAVTGGGSPRDDARVAAWLGVPAAAVGRGHTGGPVEGSRASDQLDEREAGDRPEGDGGGDGPAHRRLIRAQLPRVEGQAQPAARQMPDFTIRQPGSGRPGRFRPRPAGEGQGQGRGADRFRGRSHGFDRQGSGHGGPQRHGERHPTGHHPAKPDGFKKRGGSNRKRSK